MLPPNRNMSITVATLRRLTRFVTSTNVPRPTAALVTRAFSLCSANSSPLEPVVATRTYSAGLCHESCQLLDGHMVRGYATATKKKRGSTKKKTGTKKKTPKRKAAKKPAKKKARKVAKKPKKPSRPKVLNIPSQRAVSAYVVYIQSQLHSVKGGDPKTRLTDIAAQWRALSEAEKDTWKTRAEAVNASRKQEYNKIVSKLSPSQIREENAKRRLLKSKFKGSKRRTKLIKDPNAPKRPMTPFLRFATENYTPGTNIAESAKEAGQRWKAMSGADKSQYVRAYESDKARYAREKAAYESS